MESAPYVLRFDYEHLCYVVIDFIEFLRGKCDIE